MIDTKLFLNRYGADNYPFNPLLESPVPKGLFEYISVTCPDYPVYLSGVQVGQEHASGSIENSSGELLGSFCGSLHSTADITGVDGNWLGLVRLGSFEGKTAINGPIMLAPSCCTPKGFDNPELVVQGVSTGSLPEVLHVKASRDCVTRSGHVEASEVVQTALDKAPVYTPNVPSINGVSGETLSITLPVADEQGMAGVTHSVVTVGKVVAVLIGTRQEDSTYSCPDPYTFKKTAIQHSSHYGLSRALPLDSHTEA